MRLQSRAHAAHNLGAMQAGQIDLLGIDNKSACYHAGISVISGDVACVTLTRGWGHSGKSLTTYEYGVACLKLKFPKTDTSHGIHIYLHS